MASKTSLRFQENNAAEIDSQCESGTFFLSEAESPQGFCSLPRTSGPPRCGRLLHPRGGMFSCSLAGPVPSAGPVEPEWSREAKTAWGDGKWVWFQ